MSEFGLLAPEDKRLRQPAEPWDFENDSKEALERLIGALRENIVREKAVGIAAPQIGVSKQVFMIQLTDPRRLPSLPRIPLTVFINPVILKFSRRTGYFIEGCLSVEEIQVRLRRPKWIWVSWQDQYGRRYTNKLSGIFARIFQHEYDHLQGILITDYLDF